MINHPEYDTFTKENDIAVIKVSNPRRLNCKKNAVWPACLPTRGKLVFLHSFSHILNWLGEKYAGYSQTLVTGWGTTEIITIPGVGSVSVGLSPVLLKTRVVPVSNNRCERAMGRGTITRGMICAGARGTDSCQGDSGGPLVSQSSSHAGYSLVGITSWGYGCAEPGTYGVYARVDNYMDWVARQFGFTGVA